jgi:hypothetical protein
MPAQTPVARVLAAALALVAALPAAVWAAEPALSALTLQPGAAAADGWHVRSAAPVALGSTTAKVLVHYSRLPARLRSGNQRQVLLGDLGVAELGAHVGLPKDWSVGVQLPMAFVMRGGGPNLLQLDTLPVAPAVGDLRLETRRSLTAKAMAGGTLHLAGRLGLQLPTADASSWLSQGTAAEAEVLASHIGPRLAVHAGLGTRFSATQKLKVQPVLADGTLDPSGPSTVALVQGPATATVRLGGVQELLTDVLQVRAELQWLAPLSSAKQTGSILDLVVGADWQWMPGWRLVAMGGGSPTSTLGSAGLRLGIGLAVDPAAMASDRDRDGVDDRVDRCPAQAEDRDGFADADGCPDLDDDSDGVPDTADRCLEAAEDRDGFADADGCPDLDNDSDGVPDTSDACPAAPEDRDGVDDTDGCPDLDDDGDGLPDADDLCPQQPESKNGFEDTDGCPDVVPAPVTSP